MEWKKIGKIAGVIIGTILGMKYLFPVLLPLFWGWIFSECVYPLARFLAKKKVIQKLRITENGIGAGIILLLTLAVMAVLFWGAQYLTGKIGECVEAFPKIKKEAEILIDQCCQGAEHVMGIPAEESREYIYRQVHAIETSFFEGNRGMDAAAESVRACIVAIGAVIVVIVSAILFLQERERIRRFFENRRLYRRIRHLKQRLAGGVRAYIKAQVKIMGIVCVVCILGFWFLEISGFFGFGLAVGILDAFPVLGTGTFLIPGGILFLLQGKTFQGVGFFILYLVTAGIRQFLEPRMIGSHVGVSPLLVFLSVYLGLIVYGAAGFILGPVTGLILYGILQEWEPEGG